MFTSPSHSDNNSWTFFPIFFFLMNYLCIEQLNWRMYMFTDVCMCTWNARASNNCSQSCREIKQYTRTVGLFTYTIHSCVIYVLGIIYFKYCCSRCYCWCVLLRRNDRARVHTLMARLTGIDSGDHDDRVLTWTADCCLVGLFDYETIRRASV